jgi:hypothetical protein
MWRMQSGNRVLTESEWELFSVGLDLLRDCIEDDIDSETNDTDTGIVSFDRLTPEQKLVLLADTACALRDPQIVMPRHTSANEGAIAAVFSEVSMQLAAEIEEAGTTDAVSTIRRRLRAVFDDGDWDEPLPDETSADLETWEELLEAFRNRIFWDDDYAMEDDMLDLPPDVASEVLAELGTDRDYFRTVPPEPDDAGLIAARQKLARLLGLPVKDDDGLFPALDDFYHGLIVGPCSSKEVAVWKNHPWVEVIGILHPEWECDFRTWMADFSPAVPNTPFELNPTSNTEAPAEMPAGHRVERRGDTLVVRDSDGAFWCGLVENSWTDNPDDMPLLTFATEAAARSALAQADKMYGERVARRTAALARLGRPE